MPEKPPYKLPVVREESEEGLLRREMLQLMGSGLALAACEPSRGQILPYVRQPRELNPGKAQIYATSLTDRGIAWGLLVRTYAGRPVKADGNPDHPTTRGGGSTPQLQASIYDLYDPTRGKGIRRGVTEIPWSILYRTLRDLPPRGRGLHLLLEPTSSPLLVTQIERVRQAFPEARFHFFDPLAATGEEEALRLAFGAPRRLRLRLDQAWSIACFDADFLGAAPERIRYAFDFARNRRALQPSDRMNRLWVAEGDLTITGAAADERMRARPSAIPSLLASLVGELSRLAGQGAGGAPPPSPWIRRLAQDLWRNRGTSAVLAGERQPPEAHLCALLANQLLGNLGPTVEVSEPVIFEQGQPSHGLAPLVQALERGAVHTLLILGGDPARTAPPDLGLAAALPRAGKRLYLGTHENRTAALADYYVAAVHPFESWGDARAHDGTISLAQPMIRPLWGGRSPAEILAALLGDPDPSTEKLLRQRYAQLDLEAWQAALQWGFLQGGLPHLDVPPDEARLREGMRRAARSTSLPAIELSIRPDPKLGDGQSARNAWLVELPDAISSLQWGNAALMSPQTADRLGVTKERMVEIRANGETVALPALPLRGMADDVIGLHWGWGLRGPGWAGGRKRDGAPVGVDVSPLRRSDAPWILEAEVVPAEREIPFVGGMEADTRPLAFRQLEFEQHGRPIVLTETVAAFRENPDFVHPHNQPAPNVYGRPWTFSGNQWGMGIDLSTCLGCGACVVACQAENNLPVVGEVNCRKSRDMYWLRIDRYFSGADDDDVQYLPQPMLCQHCEMAPCEYVCPVNATVHSPDGLNEMVYNRCIGTRFCSNNCPYKVRRFNFFRYNHHEQPETLKMLHNPEVTVRERGVMEKCTYCVQRIRMAQIDARIEGREIRDGEVKTACQEACPTQCIVFGLISDPESEVTRLRSSPRTYSLLNAELGTEPRTQYLAHLRNTEEA